MKQASLRGLWLYVFVLTLAHFGSAFALQGFSGRGFSWSGQHIRRFAPRSMHHLRSIVLSIMFALPLIGCEHVVDIELPYDERIVVNTFFGRNTIDVSQADIEYVKYLDRPRGGSNDVFGFGGSNPYFNVAGRGIGLFIGASSTGEVRVPLEPVQ